MLQNSNLFVSGSIDIDRVIRERDFHTVDENVNNVIDYCLESEYDVKILDPNFVKLFRLAQLAVEYLLYCKQYLDFTFAVLKDEFKLKLEETKDQEEKIKELKDEIKKMEERYKEKSKALETKSDIHKVSPFNFLLTFNSTISFIADSLLIFSVLTAQKPSCQPHSQTHI